MGRILIAGLVWLCAVAAAGAGPWPRDPGQAFLSLSVERDRSGNSYTSVYAEYGLARRRTLGFELGYTNVGETTAIVWYQKSLDGGQGPYKLSYAMGFGAVRRDGEIFPLSQASLMLGRGFSGIGDGGWMTAEAKVKVAGQMEEVTVREGLSQIEYAYLTPEVVGKLDLTVGFRPTPDWAVVNQLRLEARKDSDLQVKLASSVVYDIASPARLELGVVAPFSGPGELALKVGTWLEF